MYLGVMIIFSFDQIIVDCSGEDGQEKTPDTAFLNKKTALLQLVEENPVPRTIVFCNKVFHILTFETYFLYFQFSMQHLSFYFGVILQKKKLQIETCRKVENLLKRFDRKGNCVQVLPFHAAMTQESRLASMEEFTRSPSKGVSQFMVCTDRYDLS